MQTCMHIPGVSCSNCSRFIELDRNLENSPPSHAKGNLTWQGLPNSSDTGSRALSEVIQLRKKVQELEEKLNRLIGG
jgi:hypothetical protein